MATILNDKKGYSYLSSGVGDDTYIIENINKSWSEIEDKKATEVGNYDNDVLQIKNVKANDLILFFDVSTNSSAEIDDNLQIIKKSSINSVISQSNKLSKLIGDIQKKNPELDYETAYNLAMTKNPLKSGNIDIINYFGTKNNDWENGEYGSNYIKTIQTVDKNGITKTLDVEEYIEDVKEEVTEFLNKYNYSSALEALNSKHKNKLLNIYKNATIDLVIEGTSDNDKMTGENGDDTFYFTNASGNDTLYSSKGTDEIYIEATKNSKEISFSKYKNDLIISYGQNDSIAISNYLKAPQKSSFDKITVYNKDNKETKEIDFEDITLEFYGDNSKKNKLTGTNINDYITGGNLNDTIKGGKGDDTLYGAKGNDKLYGDDGDDTFLFKKGDGNDTIYSGKGKDIIKIDEIDANSVSYYRDKNNLIINYGNEGDSITVSNYFKLKNSSIDILDINKLKGYISLKNDIIVSSIYEGNGISSYNGDSNNNLIYANGKYDYITANSGNDIIQVYSKKYALVNGGTGSDTYYVNSLKTAVQIFENVSNANKNDNNVLNINEKTNNINILFDVKANGKTTNEKSLLIINNSTLKNLIKYRDIDKVTSGIELDNYFEFDSLPTIKTINSKNGYSISLEEINEVKSQVASWLSENNYSSTINALAEATKSEINELIGIYQSIEWQQV